MDILDEYDDRKPLPNSYRILSILRFFWIGYSVYLLVRPFITTTSVSIPSLNTLPFVIMILLVLYFFLFRYQIPQAMTEFNRNLEAREHRKFRKYSILFFLFVLVSIVYSIFKMITNEVGFALNSYSILLFDVITILILVVDIGYVIRLWRINKHGYD